MLMDIHREEHPMKSFKMQEKVHSIPTAEQSWDFIAVKMIGLQWCNMSEIEEKLFGLVGQEFDQ